MKVNSNVKHTKKALNALIKIRKHWEDMIEWVKKQDKAEMTNGLKMDTEISQDWYAGYCALCNLYNNECECTNCPFTFYKCNCLKDHSIWEKVSHSETWGEWLINARKLLKKINEIIKIYESQVTK